MKLKKTQMDNKQMFMSHGEEAHQHGYTWPRRVLSRISVITALYLHQGAPTHPLQQDLQGEHKQYK